MIVLRRLVTLPPEKRLYGRDTAGGYYEMIVTAARMALMSRGRLEGMGMTYITHRYIPAVSSVIDSIRFHNLLTLYRSRTHLHVESALAERLQISTALTMVATMALETSGSTKGATWRLPLTVSIDQVRMPD